MRENKLHEIPKEWKWVRLEEVCLLVTDGTHDTPKPQEKGKPLVTSKNIKNGKIDISNTYKISLEEFHQVNKRSKVDRWDILFSMIGTVGEVAIVKNEADFAIKNVGLFKPYNKIPIPILSYSEQQKIVEEIEYRLSIADKLEKTVDKLLKLSEKLKQSYLKYAFEGKLTEEWRKQNPHLITGENSVDKLLEKIKSEKEKFEKQKKKKTKKVGV